MKPVLSILVCSVFERDATKLLKKLLGQIGKLPVELLVLTDNRRRSTGLKRQALLDMAQGDYVTYIDDDDDVSADYVAEVLGALTLPDADGTLSVIMPMTDVLVFNSESRLLGYGFGENPYVVHCGIEFENEQTNVNDKGWREDIHRKPWHWCVWRAEVARMGRFPDGYMDDDWYWLRQLMPHVVRQKRVDKVLHYYVFNKTSSLSNQGTITCT